MEKREMMEQEIKRLGKVNPESEKKANPESEKKVNPESEKQDKEELDVHKENASGMRVWQADDVRGKLYFDNPELCAQFLRYEVCIWADWEKEMRARGYGKPGQKGFRYPPVLPIVYYEGSGTWTADLHLSGRIAMAEMFSEFIPDFTYRVVRNHDYSNDELMERADEISLLMMLGKIQKAGDIEALRRIQPEQIDAIMKKASPAVVDILARTVWALCRKMNLPENEAEDYVRSVKEGKMGYIFENMEKMDIQEERRKTAEARQELQAARQAAWQEVEEVRQEARQEVEEIRQEARQEVEEVRKAARQELQAAQKNLIESFQKSGADKGLVIQMLCSGFSLSQADAEKTVNRYWESSSAH